MNILKGLEDFLSKNPSFQLWDGLLNFIQTNYDSRFSHILVYRDGKLFDTRNWNGQDNPEILFREEFHL